ncbi:helix-turn-helix domain-containing protein [Streptacidiphilus griseoplanus]|uniref:helix-turn-helix domain-containing protein n=1 Tax=Peterkaempfera griseoplana TaxID=66896 RepID=UPI0006E32FFD|nr:helix-turn-helix domain-containing protein [Peterkaempfera griseoplana]
MAVSDISGAGPPSSSPPIHIQIPLAHPSRDEVLRRRWRSVSRNGYAHVHSLRFPKQYTTGQFRCWIDPATIGDITVSDQYGDAVEGISGGTDRMGAAQRLAVVHIIRSGGLSLTAAGRTVHVPPGMLCVRDAGMPWEFSTLPGTRWQVLQLPYEALASTGLDQLPTLALVPQTAPEARLLTGQLQVTREARSELTPAGLRAAEQSVLHLVAGTLMAQGVSADSAFRPSLRAAARNCADARLTDPDLSPAEIAKALSVSVRTLHRAFSEADESLMAYVRRRRLERARQELATLGGRYTLSAVAARWHFADASHFSRAFKRQFGETPSSLTR